MRWNGHGDLRQILSRAGVVSTIGEPIQGFTSLYSGYPVTVSGPAQADQLGKLVELLKSTIFVDLSPQLDECYALGPYTVFDGEVPRRTAWGESLNGAKYGRDGNEQEDLLGWIEEFIKDHPSLKAVDAIIAAPKSDLSTPDLAGTWAQEIGLSNRWQQLTARRTRAIRPQKEFADTETEEDLIARVANSVNVEGVTPRSRVLILDDTIRSGGTLKEIARALRESGASEVYGLAVAKDARLTQGGVDLAKERWE
jgi:hypothetical protein